jgi:hypothetical protein
VWWPREKSYFAGQVQVSVGAVLLCVGGSDLLCTRRVVA